MDNFTNTFNIISGVCSIISLFIGIFVANKVTKIYNSNKIGDIKDIEQNSEGSNSPNIISGRDTHK
ncbi:MULTISPECIES: hypothetical protein [Clostridium]|uniref:Uncharacterized protein n=3 Tax=Clostridium botulinum TaxID=1491 RepID=A7GEF5_CLOBL|nr:MULTISPECIES: hypothetical protein [Clostridium]ABS41718.1 hypothetical protein CLI_1907 [Clostridium botulinum F str. Langeland]ACO86712.1 conserved hypothetical protein [Clostridium botulinum A2 str. Kyoto]ADF99583.1 hypothetical protein CBF_1888 [Clostridium botulinum F str. 230613]AUN04028.1 hypothetical protein RSJ19_14405 [Clostridium botulinum]KKM42839.1 hypothetical protein VT72_04150 [Clostridium botulinum]